MTAQIIDGRKLAKRIQGEIKREAEAFAAQHGYPPGLGVVLVGDDPASHMYVGMKQRRAAEAGIADYTAKFPPDATQEAVIAKVRAFNADPRVHGILVQLPLPAHISDEAVLREISLEKDADGIHPINVGYLAMKGRQPTFTPATPTGCMTILEDIGVDPSGKIAVVVGRSNIVGMPVALLLNNANATVTICHSHTPDMPAIIRTADILVAAIGKPDFVQAAWLKPGVVVIDVGTNKVADPTASKGYRWVGDVEFEGAQAVASYITQVPGGVGPMTINTLLSNTMKAARLSVR